MFSQQFYFQSVVLVVFALSAVVSGFKLPNNKLLTNTKKGFKSTLLQSTVNAEDLPGVLPPTGYFDPLNLSANISDETLKKWREAEIKHGRVSMLAAIGILVQESNFHPFFGGKVMGAAIYHFQQVESLFPPFWYLLLLSIGIIEGYTINKGWGERGVNGLADLKEEYVPGDLGFDPLGLRPPGGTDYSNLSPDSINMQTKELQNGRLAMIAIAAFVSQELVDFRGILEHYNEFGFGSAGPASP